MVYRIGTRGSALATTQAGHVRDALSQRGHAGELTIITTPGDLSQAPVERIGVGVFTSALREAMGQHRCDMAVHSFKDLPTAPDPRFHLVVPPREDRREALIARDGLTLEQLPRGAKVGTSAPRRVSQLRALRPDLEICPLRGNIDSRMGRVTEGQLDAVVLAAAGLTRLGLVGRATELFSPEVFMPAPAQGALAVECRAEDTAAVAALDAIACPTATLCAVAERAILARLEAGCTAPVAAFAQVDTDEAGERTLRVTGGVFGLDGRVARKATDSRSLAGVADEAAVGVAVGVAVAEQLLAAGARELM